MGIKDWIKRRGRGAGTATSRTRGRVRDHRGGTPDPVVRDHREPAPSEANRDHRESPSSQRPPTTGSIISGQLTDTVEGSVRHGAYVVFEGLRAPHDSRTAVAEGSGNYEAHLDPGSYRVTVDVSGYPQVEMDGGARGGGVGMYPARVQPYQQDIEAYEFERHTANFEISKPLLD